MDGWDGMDELWLFTLFDFLFNDVYLINIWTYILYSKYVRKHSLGIKMRCKFRDSDAIWPKWSVIVWFYDFTYRCVSLVPSADEPIFVRMIFLSGIFQCCVISLYLDLSLHFIIHVSYLSSRHFKYRIGRK